MHRILLVTAVAACGGTAPTTNSAATQRPSLSPAATPPAASDTEATAMPWPGAPWDRAEAIIFNQVEYTWDQKLLAWSPEAGWNDNITSRTPLTAGQARIAADLVAASNGSVEVSQCAFPRHAVVFLAGDQPVGSANLSFECGDLITVPEPKPARADADANADADEAMRWVAEDLARIEIYENELLPRWRELFEVELAIPIE